MTSKNHPRSRSRVISTEKFLSYHGHKAQELTDLTNLATDLYRALDGMPRFVVSNWPCKGELIKTFNPAAAGSKEN